MTLFLTPEELNQVKAILQMHVPNRKVYAFGSRVHGRGLKTYSDLDLVVETETPIPVEKIASLKETFSASDLPFRVDVVGWAASADNLTAIANQQEHVVIQQDNKEPKNA